MISNKAKNAVKKHHQVKENVPNNLCVDFREKYSFFFSYGIGAGEKKETETKIIYNI